MENEGIGRNCTLFNIIRRKAYRTARVFKREGRERGEFQQFLTDYGWEGNTEFACPLGYSEVACIARSVAKFAWNKMSDEELSKKQSFRISCRWSGHVKKEPWVEMGVSRRTYYRRKRSLSG